MDSPRISKKAKKKKKKKHGSDDSLGESSSHDEKLSQRSKNSMMESFSSEEKLKNEASSDNEEREEKPRKSKGKGPLKKRGKEEKEDSDSEEEVDPVSDKADWESVSDAKSIHVNPVYKVKFGSKKFVVKLQGAASSKNEKFLNNVAAKMGFITANTRIIPFKGPQKGEGYRCVKALSKKTGDKQLLENYDKGAYTSVFVMDFLEGSSLGTEKEDDSPKAKAEKYESLGRLMAFQVFTAGADRFLLSGLTSILNSGNIRLDAKGTNIQAIDNDVMSSMSNQGSKKAKKDGRVTRANLMEDPEHFAELYFEKIETYLKKLIKSSSHGKVSNLVQPTIARMEEMGYKLSKEDIAHFQHGILQGINDMVEMDWDIPSMMGELLETLAPELNQVYINPGMEKSLSRLSTDQREGVIKDMEIQQMGLLRGRFFEAFMAAMQKKIGVLMAKNSKKLGKWGVESKKD